MDETSKKYSPTQDNTTRSRRLDAYKDILAHTQAELPAGARVLSRLIHLPVVEQVFGVVASALMRPIPLLLGGIVALLAGGAGLFVSLRYGYPLSGSEYIAGFIAGWIIGVVADCLHAALARK